MKKRIASFRTVSVVILLLTFILGASSCAVTNRRYVRLNDSQLTEESKSQYKSNQNYSKQEVPRPKDKEDSGKGNGDFLTWIFGGMFNLTSSSR